MGGAEHNMVNVELALDEGEDNPLEAPAIKEWYHGVLNRGEAEELLLQDGRPGAYLIRERSLHVDQSNEPCGGPTGDRMTSEDTARYALSFLNNDGKVSHFKIRSYYGTYLIGGTSFESLQSLVGYYTNKGFILSGERLQHPVAPAGEPIEVKERLVAVLPYNKNPDSDELSFAKHDIFVKEEELSDGWLWVTALASRASGLVHSYLVRPLNNDVGVRPEDLDYFYGPEVTQDEVKALLCGQPKGAYLLRPSERVPGNYTLYVVCSDAPNHHIKRFQIVVEGSKLCMGTQLTIKFNTIDEIVTRYRSREIALDCCLTMPILKRGATGCLLDEDDIYDSVRRAQKPLVNSLSGGAGNGASETILEGYLLKLNKKWKRMYFILKRSDLLYFECSKSGQYGQKIKPKGIIDLSRTDFYPVDPSLHGRSNCFQLVVVNQHQSSQVHVLYCESDDDTDMWRKHLRLYCTNTHEAAEVEQKRQQPRCVRDLYVTICNASNLSSSKPYVVMIYLNNIQVARTNPQDGKDPSWDEEFSLCDLASNINYLVVSVFPKSSRRRENDGEIRKQLALDELDGEHIETVETDGRKFRFRIRFSKLNILPRERLTPIEYALVKNPKVYGPLARFAEAKLDENQRKTLAQSLLHIFLMFDRQAELILGIGNAVIDAGNKDGLQFRQNTLLSSLLFCYMKLTAMNWMHSCLDRVTQEIMKLGKLEIDTDPSHCPMCSALQSHPVPLHPSSSSSSSHPAMLPSSSGFSSLGASGSMTGCLCDKNSAKLNELLTIAVDDICAHCNEFPSTLRHVLSQLHLRVVSQWYLPPHPTDTAAAAAAAEAAPPDPHADSADPSQPPPQPAPSQPPPHSTAQDLHKVHVVAASFIFLRFLCRALYQPYPMSLIKEQPCEVTQRTMKSLGGLIQNLGNGVQPKNKKYEVMQPYLEELQPRITAFISNLMSSPPNGQPPAPSAIEVKHKKSISLSREFSQVLALLSRHLEALRDVAELEHLVAAVEAVLATDTSHTSRR